MTALVMLAMAAGLSAQSSIETEGTTGAVFVMTNSASGNEIVAYKRNADGSLENGRRFQRAGAEVARSPIPWHRRVHLLSPPIIRSYWL